MMRKVFFPLGARSFFLPCRVRSFVFGGGSVANYKSRVACEFSVDRLVSGRPAYLWTFTFSDCLPVEVACKLWSNLARDLVRQCGFYGLRVFELHPGGHGIHVHVVTPVRYDVNVIRRYSSLHGFGRINVIVIPSDACKYVAKYVAKGNVVDGRRVERDASLKGKRLWSPVGKSMWPQSPSRVADVELTSPTRDVFDLLRGKGRISFRRAVQLYRVARLVVAGFVALRDESRGMILAPSSMFCSAFPVSSEYLLKHSGGAYLVDDILFDLDWSVDN